MRTVRSLPLGTAGVLGAFIAALAGCSTAPTGPLSAAQIADIHKGVSTALIPLMLAANKRWLNGTVALDLVIDRDNQLLSCKATRMEGAPELVPVVEQACWATVLPSLPPEAFRADGKAKLRTPVSVRMNRDGNPTQRAYFEAVVFPMFAQNQYFWDHGISRVAFRSVGEAGFRYVADHEGRVLACTAKITANEARKEAFKQNPQLVANLQKACLGMNLAKMPGFLVADNGLAAGTVWTTYAPWRKAAPRFQGQ